MDRVGRRNQDPARRIVDITPAGHADIAVTLGPSANCDEVDPLCSEDGAGLGAPVTWTITGAGAPGPFTAAFDNAPESNDGSTAFPIDVMFSETPYGTSRYLRPRRARDRRR